MLVLTVNDPNHHIFIIVFEMIISKVTLFPIYEKLFMKIILEIFFVYFYYLLQRRQADNEQQSNKNLNFFNAWVVPYTYSCTLDKIKAVYPDYVFNACQNGATQCWVPRPVEKRVMMWYMLTMSVVSTSLGLIFVSKINDKK